uniref:Transmembrane protein n=1 Tax=Globodera pallida TaxID=36090 RepID=A0A183BXC9_GLOPA
MTSKMNSKWVVFGSCLLFFASGCVLYALIMTGHWVNDELAMTDDQNNDEALNSALISDDDHGEHSVEGEQKKDSEEVLLLEQSIKGASSSPAGPRVHYERSPDGRMKATMDITLHYERRRTVVAADKVQ